VTTVETDRSSEEPVEAERACGDDEDSFESSDCTCEGGIVRLPADPSRFEQTEPL
jgi:hypothetical protein